MCVGLDKLRGYTLDQEEAICDLLRYNGMADADPTRTPIAEDFYEGEADDAEICETARSRAGLNMRELQSLFGSLLWVARCTRPDITFAVHKATRQTHAPLLVDWKLKSALRST